jgi:hypothetical protein
VVGWGRRWRLFFHQALVVAGGRRMRQDSERRMSKLEDFVLRSILRNPGLRKMSRKEQKYLLLRVIYLLNKYLHMRIFPFRDMHKFLNPTTGFSSTYFFKYLFECVFKYSAVNLADLH